MAEKLKLITGESRTFRFDFTKQVEIQEGETLTGSPTVTASPTGLTLGTAVVDSTGKKVLVQISSGAVDQTYEVQVVVSTSGGATLKECGELLIIDC